MPNIKPQIDVVTVGVASLTLTALLAAAAGAPSINKSTQVITLIPQAAGVYMDDTTATAGSHPMGTNAFKFNGAAELAALAFIAPGGNTLMTVIQEG